MQFSSFPCITGINGSEAAANEPHDRDSCKNVAAASPLAAQAYQTSLQLQAAMARLPPADVLQLDSGYLVIRRRHGRHDTAASRREGGAPYGPRPAESTAASAAAQPVDWGAAREQRYRRQLQHLRLLAAWRLQLQEGAAEQRFATAVLAAAALQRVVLAHAAAAWPPQ